MKNQQAFPPGNWGDGMSLRDWFAGQALVGLLAKYGEEGKTVLIAYGIADDMLAEREKQPKE